MDNFYDIVVVGSGPAGLGAAFHLAENTNKSIIIFDKAKISSGGLRNDCKQNYTYPVGFPTELWNKKYAEQSLKLVANYLNPEIQTQQNLAKYFQRAKKLNVELFHIKQAHVGTDKAVVLIRNLLAQLRKLDVKLQFNVEVTRIDYQNHKIYLDSDHVCCNFENIILAPGRAGFRWLQTQMDNLSINYVDNVVDVGIRLEMKEEHYPIVRDYYDPKFLFKDDVRTFCTNSGAAYVVKEKYDNYFSINGHSLSKERKRNGLVNFAFLKTISLTDPVVSGHQFADILGQMAMKLSGGQPMMQRVGDFRMGKRSKTSTFNKDLYNFMPTLKHATPGDVSLAIPAKIMRDIWKSMKMLDTIVPGIMHPSTIIYYPEIKTYANKPSFINQFFEVKKHVYMIGDGAGTSRGITAAWASGIRAAKGIMKD